MPSPIFTLNEAKASGFRKDQVYKLLEQGEIQRVGRGVFMMPDQVEPNLVALAAASAAQPKATLCLTSALAYYDLTDTIPFGNDIALPRGTRCPAGIPHAIWHSFDVDTFDIGRMKLSNHAGIKLFIYSPERCIIDMFRLAHLEGQEAAVSALKRWLEKPGNSAGALLQISKHFPKTLPFLRRVLEVLL